MIKIKYSKFSIKVKTHIFNQLLDEHNIENKVVTSGEDINVFSCFNVDPKISETCKFKIFYSGESSNPVTSADINVGFFDSSKENCFNLKNYERLHYHRYRKYDVYSSLTTPEISEDKKFCLFSVSNSAAKFRKWFFNFLTKYKKVDSIGSVFNNTKCNFSRIDHDNYESFIRQYNFMIAMENKSYPWYVTEKIYNAMRGNSVPIYWGDNLHAETIFNPKSFISVKDKDGFSGALEKVKYYLDNPNVINKEPYVNEEDAKKQDLGFKKTCDNIVDRMVESVS